MKKFFSTSLSLIALTFLTVFGFAQAKAEYMYKVVVPGNTYFVSEGDTFEGEINTLGGTLSVTVTDQLPAGTLLDSEGVTIPVTSQGKDGDSRLYTYEDLEEGQYVYTIANPSQPGSYTFEFEASDTGGGGGGDNEEAQIVFFGQKYDVPAFTGFKGQFELYSAMTISVITTGGDLYDENGRLVDFTNVKYGSPNCYVYEDLPAGVYVYEIDMWNNMDGTTIEFQYGEADAGSGDDGGDGPVDIEFGKTYTLDAWEAFEGSFFNFDPTTLHVIVNGNISGTLLDGMGNEVALLDTAYGDDGSKDYSYTIGSDMYTYTVGMFDNMDGGSLLFQLGDGDNGGDDDNGGFEGEIELGKTYELKAGNIFSGSFDVESAGVLTVVGNPAIPAEAIYTAGPTSEMTQVGETENTPEGQKAVYNITAGTYGGYFFISEDMTISYSFVADGEEEPEPDVPSDKWTNLQLDQEYAATATGSVMLIFTPTANGTLTANQMGSYDSHFYTSEPVYNDEFGWLLNTATPPVRDYQSGDTEPYALPYVLTAGKTYFYLAKTSEYDDITSVTFTWEDEAAVEKIIEVDVQQQVKQYEVYKFTAPMTGILTVNTNQYSTGIAIEPSTQFVLFSNVGCTDNVAPLSVSGGELGGFSIKFFVEEGDVYYVTNPIQTATNFLLTMEAQGSITPELVNIEPLPGRAYDNTNNKYYINMIFSPANATAEKVEVSYVDADNQTITFESPEFGYNQGAFRIDVRQLTAAMDDGNVKDLSDITVKLYGVKSMGQYLTKSLIETGVELGEEGLVTLTYSNEKPITLVSAELPDPLESNGTQKAVLTFSGDVASVGEASLVQGTQYWGSEGGGEEPDPSVIIPNDNIYIETNTVTIDFTGVDLSSIEAGPVTLFVQAIQGTNGLNAVINGYAVYQGYTTLVETEAPACSVDHFVPAYNEELEVAADGTATFEVVFTAPAKVESAEAPVGPNVYNCTVTPVDPVDGYATNWNVVIPAAYISLMQEEDLGASINLTVVDEAGNTVTNSQSELYVVVTFALPAGEPGVDFDLQMATDVTDGALSTFTVLVPEGYDYVAPNNYVNNDTGKNEFASITITDGKDFIAHPVTSINAEDFDGVVTFEPAITQSGTYTVTIPYNAFTIGIEGGELEGQGGNEAGISKASRAKEFEYVVTIAASSQATYQMTPEYMSLVDVAEDGTVSFDITFSVPVTLKEYKYGSQGDGNLAVTPAPGDDVYETSYTFTFPQYYVEHVIYGWTPDNELGRQLIASIFAEDANGNRVTRTEGGITFDDINVCYYVNTDAPAGVPFEVTVDTEANGSLNTFSVAVLEGFDSIEAVDEDAWDDLLDTYVNYFQNITITGDDFKATATSYENGVVTFEPAIKNSGDYTLTIPYHAFAISIANDQQPEGQTRQEGDIIYWSQEKTVNFSVKIESAGIVNLYDIDAADGYTVVSMNGVVLINKGTASDLNKLLPGMYIVNGKKVVVRK